MRGWHPMPNDAQHVREVIERIRAAKQGETVTMLPVELGGVLNCLVGDTPLASEEIDDGQDDHD